MLGDARSDLVAILAIPLGKAKAEQTLANLEAVVRGKATEGVDSAVDAKIPSIRQTVKVEVDKQVRPLFIGAGVLGGVGVLFALAATLKSRKCAR